jgi:hypothetical protein
VTTGAGTMRAGMMREGAAPGTDTLTPLTLQGKVSAAKHVESE